MVVFGLIYKINMITYCIMNKIKLFFLWCNKLISKCNCVCEVNEKCIHCDIKLKNDTVT